MASASAGRGSPASLPIRRVRKGMRAADLLPGGTGGRELRTVGAIDSSFQLQEYLQLILSYVASKGSVSHEDVESIVRLPDTTLTAGGLNPEADPGSCDGAFLSSTDGVHEPHSLERDVWVYEHLKRIVQDLGSHLVPALQQACRAPQFGGPVQCSAMNAGAWTFLCAAHGNGERQCPAIDYTQHTLDAITSTLVSPRLFPSRTYVPPTSVRHFASISRRISRVFLHAREHHRDVFDSCEAETQLYDRFYTLCKRYELTQIDGLPLPPGIVRAQSTQSEWNRAESFDRGSFLSNPSSGGPGATSDSVEAAAPSKSADLSSSHSASTWGIDDTDADWQEHGTRRQRAGSDTSVTSVVPNVHAGQTPSGEIQVEQEAHGANTTDRNLLTSKSDVTELTNMDVARPLNSNPKSVSLLVKSRFRPEISNAEAESVQQGQAQEHPSEPDTSSVDPATAHDDEKVADTTPSRGSGTSHSNGSLTTEGVSEAESTEPATA